MEYIIVERDIIDDLSEEVNRLMEDGWEPQGGVSAYNFDLNYYYCQAMIRKHKGEL